MCDSAITGGTGTWDTTLYNWTADSGSTNIKWNNSTAYTGIFGGTSGDVTLGRSISLDGMTFNTSGYVIQGPYALTLKNLGIIDTATSTSTTVKSNFAGSVGLTKTGSGTLTLQNNSTYTGDTNIQAGVLQLNNNAALPSTTIVNITSGSLDLNSRNQTIAGLTGSAYVTNSSATTSYLTVNGSTNTTFSGVIENPSGYVSLTKDGSGTLTLSGPNTYSGVTTITNGILSISSIAIGGSTSGIGNSTSAASNLQFDGGTLQYSGTTTSTDRGFTITDNKVAIIDVATSNSNLTVSSNTSSGDTGTNSGLTKVGLGTLTLSGTNAYEGATTVKAGILNVTGSLDNSVLGNGNVGGESAVTVGGTGSSGTPTLAGSGTINGATVIAAAGGGVVGHYSPGGRSTDGATSVVGVQTFGNASQTTGNKTTLAFQAGSIFEWQLTSNTTSGRETNFDGININAGCVTISSTAQIKLAFTGTDFTDHTFWDQTHSWKVFTSFDGTTSIATSGSFIVDATAVPYTTDYPLGNFYYNSSNGTVNWTVPEPSNALAGLLLAAGLLRRRR